MIGQMAVLRPSPELRADRENSVAKLYTAVPEAGSAEFLGLLLDSKGVSRTDNKEKW